MVGLNIESIVSFPHNTFQSGERCYRGGNIGSRVIDSLFFPIACTDSSSHSFSKRATISGIAKGGRGHAPILQTICCHHMCSFKLKMQQNRFRLELRPGHRWRKLWRSQPLIGLGGDLSPFPSPSTPLASREGLSQLGGPRAPKGIKTALSGCASKCTSVSTAWLPDIWPSSADLSLTSTVNGICDLLAVASYRRSTSQTVNIRSTRVLLWRIFRSEWSSDFLKDNILSFCVYF